jgi:hypothetical protein
MVAAADFDAEKKLDIEIDFKTVAASLAPSCQAGQQCR